MRSTCAGCGVEIDRGTSFCRSCARRGDRPSLEAARVLITRDIQTGRLRVRRDGLIVKKGKRS